MTLCRGDVCVTAPILFEHVDSGFSLDVLCTVRPPPPAIVGPTVDCLNDFVNGAPVENVILISYEAPQQAAPISNDAFAIRLTNSVGDVVAERSGSPVFEKPNPPASSCNPYCTEGTL